MYQRIKKKRVVTYGDAYIFPGKKGRRHMWYGGRGKLNASFTRRVTKLRTGGGVRRNAAKGIKSILLLKTIEKRGGPSVLYNLLIHCE